MHKRENISMKDSKPSILSSYTPGSLNPRRFSLSRSGTSLVFTLLVVLLGFVHLRYGVEVLFERKTSEGAARDGTEGDVPLSPHSRPNYNISFDVVEERSDRETTRQANTEIPLGLRWFKQGYENPWSFSTLRTGIKELDAAYNRVYMRDNGKLPRLVVSFTSLPHRFDKHAPGAIRLLKNQAYPPDHIYVCIPAVSRRSNDTFRVPSWISEDKHITVMRPAVDYGPATKLIPAVRAELALNNTHTRIVTIDDDNEGGWNDQQLQALFLYSLVFENSAIGFTGWNVTCMTSDSRCDEKDSGVPRRQFSDRLYNFIKPSDDYACHSLKDWLPSYYSNCLGAVRKNYVGIVDVLEGYKGALYQPRFFDLAKIESIISKDVPNGFFLCDDVWFSGWLSTKNIKRLVVNPAIHHDARVYLRLRTYSAKRREQLTKMGAPSKEDLEEVENRRKQAGSKVEKGLHDLGDFVKSNHDSVKWFEGQNGWTKDLWKRPNGFLYASEVKVTEKDEGAN